MTERAPGGGRELLNYPSISYTTMRGWSVVGFGIAMLGVCVFCVLIWQGIVTGQSNAPLWVIGMVGVTFGFAGLLLIIYGLGDLRSDARKRLAGQTHPSEPWRGDYDWSNAMALHGMRSRDSRRWWLHVLGLAILLAMASISNWIAIDEWGSGVDGWFLLVMAVFMDLFVVLVIGLAIRRLLMRTRYGSPLIVFDCVPVRPGEMLRARVHSRGLNQVDRIVVTLREVAEIYEKRRSSRNRKPKQVVVCKELEAYESVIDDVRSQLSGDGTLPVEFMIPESARSCTLHDRPARFWDLEVHGQMRGVDFVHRFTVPVYADLSAG